MRARLKHALIAAVILTGCAESFEAPELAGVDVRLAIVHTTDIHSRLLPYHMNVLSGDSNMGLLQENAPFGGIRCSSVLRRRCRFGAVLLDVGILPWSGAP